MTWLSWPNRITIVRTLLIAPLIICLLNMNDPEWTWARRGALAILVLSGLGDILDGVLARRLRQETAVGKFLDPLADKLLIACTTILLAVPQTAVPGTILPNWVPVIAIGKDLVTVLGFGLIYVTTGRYFVHPRPLGKVCMVVQLVMIALVLLSPDLPAAARLLPRLAWWSASLLAGAAVVDYVLVGNRFAKNVNRNGQEKEPSE